MRRVVADRGDEAMVERVQELGRVVLTVPHLGTLLPVVKALVYLMAFSAAYLLWRRQRERRIAAVADGSPADG